MNTQLCSREESYEYVQVWSELYGNKIPWNTIVKEFEHSKDIIPTI